MWQVTSYMIHYLSDLWTCDLITLKEESIQHCSQLVASVLCNPISAHIHRRISVRWALSGNFSTSSTRLCFHFFFHALTNITLILITSTMFYIFFMFKEEREARLWDGWSLTMCHNQPHEDKRPFPWNHHFFFLKNLWPWTHDFLAMNLLCSHWCYWISKLINKLINA